MAFLSGGGFDATNGLVLLTRVGSAGTMQKLAFRNEVDPPNVDNSHTYHTPATFDRIKQLQRDRLQELPALQELPHLREALANLELAKASEDELRALIIPTDLVSLGNYGLGALERNMQQAQIALAAFKAGTAATVNLSVGGFDTHANHDRDQPSRITQLLGLIDFVMEESIRVALEGQVVVVACSDFARGPFYNGDNGGAGKDHWPITSMFAMGPGITGNLVIGATDADQQARRVDPDTLEVDDGGVKLAPEHVHHALRGLADLGSITDPFPLKGSPLPLFG